MSTTIRIPDLPDELEDLIAMIATTGTEVYLVGGAVRDHFLFNLNNFADIDLAHNSDVPTLIAHLKAEGWKPIETGLDFGEFEVMLGNGAKVDITRFRTETYRADSRKPTTEPVKTIEEDLARRDFTVNAIALRFKRFVVLDEGVDTEFELIDPFGGLADLKAGIIRAVGNPEERFDEDPLRIMRGLRFAVRYIGPDGNTFTILPTTFKAMQEMA